MQQDSSVVTRRCHSGHQIPAAQAGTANLQRGVKLKTPEEWIEDLVQQMAGARDMADARQRAASVLQSFEQAVLQTASATKQVCTIAFCVIGH